MAKKSINAFDQFSQNLTKAFREASMRFNQHFEKGLEAQRQTIEKTLKMSPSLEEFNRRLTSSFRDSSERLRKGLEQAFDAQREAMRRAAPALKQGLSEMPMAQLSNQFREAALEAIGTQQKAFADSARNLAMAFQKLAGESLKAMSAIGRRGMDEGQKDGGASVKTDGRKKRVGKRSKKR
ncbi:MAG TPA: hypothetical protein VMB26_11675 [Candidatus Binataceae bacterium]|nr:hypothetical protein [Candidatus Binataceae bacterium]